MMMAQEHEPQYGRRLMPLVLRELAATNPDRLYAAIPKNSSVEDGFVDITVGDLSRCVDLMAHWLSDRFGPSDRFETLCYIGISDLRGVIVFLAAVLCGYKVRHHRLGSESQLTYHSSFCRLQGILHPLLYRS